MTITRSQVLHRAKTVWRQGSVPYSMDKIHQPDGYRQDCSGYVSLAWGIPQGSWGGLNTVSLVTDGWMKPIKIDDLKPGDAVGNCGPGTAGANGHIQLFERWVNNDPNDNRYICLEQAGGDSGWQRRTHDIGRNGYKAYRYKDVVDDPAPAPKPPAPAPPAKPKPTLRRKWTLPAGNHFYGLITGPDNSHGGWKSDERDDVKAIQQRLQVLGFAPKTPGWADGKFEEPTKDAVARWQRTKYASKTTRYGEVWSDDWVRLFTY